MTDEQLVTMTAQSTPRGHREAVASLSATRRPVSAPLPRVGILGTYPPTECGLATFTAALRHGMGGTDQDSKGCGVVRIIDRPRGDSGPEVLAEIRRGSPRSRAEGVAALNQLDVVIVQHEYGIYGGHDGAEVIDIVNGIDAATIVVLHTVLDHPTANQRRIIEELAESADALVTMTRTAHRRLGDYAVDMTKVSVIPHGAHPPAPGLRPESVPERPTILTWGLLGPGKGIEWGIEAMALLGDLKVAPRYLIVGKTHPNVLQRNGEAYRNHLRARADQLGVDHIVEFQDTYSDRDTLQRTIATAHMVLLPYDSVDQVTSGVLTEAVAASKAVISSSFPHAVELLGGGAGLLVPRHDPHAIALAVRRVLTEPGLHQRMVTGAAALSPSLSWTAIGDQYQALTTTLLTARSTAVA